MDATSNETARTLSRRGHIYATEGKKTLENVINNLWDPEDNPDGFVSLGVAENVKSCRKKSRITVANLRNVGTDARRAGELCQKLGLFNLENVVIGLYC